MNDYCMETKTVASEKAQMPLGPYVAFAVDGRARQRTGYAAGIHSTHPAETARSIALLCGDEWGDDVAMKTATLFAAAPELLEALIGYTQWIKAAPENYQKHFADQLIAARAAIAKATGQS